MLLIIGSIYSYRCLLICLISLPNLAQIISISSLIVGSGFPVVNLYVWWSLRIVVHCWR